MRALAGFVMRGRREALLVAVVASVVPMFFWVGSAAVGLLTLRRGALEGGFVALWALLPCLVLAHFGDVVPAVALFGIWVVTLVLRETRSWTLTLLAVSALGLLFGAIWALRRLANVGLKVRLLEAFAKARGTRGQVAAAVDRNVVKKQARLAWLRMDWH
jgi:hypothetical protein